MFAARSCAAIAGRDRVRGDLSSIVIPPGRSHRYRAQTAQNGRAWLL